MGFGTSGVYGTDVKDLVLGLVGKTTPCKLDFSFNRTGQTTKHSLQFGQNESPDDQTNSPGYKVRTYFQDSGRELEIGLAERHKRHPPDEPLRQDGVIRYWWGLSCAHISPSNSLCLIESVNLEPIEIWN